MQRIKSNKQKISLYERVLLSTQNTCLLKELISKFSHFYTLKYAYLNLWGVGKEGDFEILIATTTIVFIENYKNINLIL